RQAVAVLARKATAVFEDQVGHVLGDVAHPADVGRVLEVEHGANVQTADRGMAVKGAISVVPAQQRPKARDELRQLFWSDGRVLDEGRWLAIARQAEQERHGGIAQ